MHIKWLGNAIEMPLRCIRNSKELQNNAEEMPLNCTRSASEMQTNTQPLEETLPGRCCFFFKHDWTSVQQPSRCPSVSMSLGSPIGEIDDIAQSLNVARQLNLYTIMSMCAWTWSRKPSILQRLVYSAIHIIVLLFLTNTIVRMLDISRYSQGKRSHTLKRPLWLVCFCMARWLHTTLGCVVIIKPCWFSTL